MAEQQSDGVGNYSLTHGAQEALDALLNIAGKQIPAGFTTHIHDVTFTTKGDGHGVYLPCPFKETEASSAMKAVEAGAAAAVADIRYGSKKRKINVDLERATCFLFSAYLSTIDGMDKAHPDVKSKLKDTDLLQAQSILYRRLSANLYETRNPGEYFHIHGSLEATTTLNMIGLEGHRPDMTDYHECIKLIESHVKQFSAEELEKMNAEKRQAGVTCLKWDEFKETSYGKTALEKPPWIVEAMETSTPPVPFPDSKLIGSKPQPLAGIRVLELCRIVAGPAIGRTLAEYGADVIKVTSPNLSDVPFFQVDGNLGKHTLSLDLHHAPDRETFSTLLSTTDILLDGYRPGSLTRLGYGPSQLLSLAQSRNKGIIYISESCFGALPPSQTTPTPTPTSPPSSTSNSTAPITHQDPLSFPHRPGWQQIADCITGLAWAQGTSLLSLSSPLVPPFPMSDYGTGCAGTIAALTGLYHRARIGGSWFGAVSLVGYDVFLMKLGLYSPAMCAAIKEEFGAAGFEGLRHWDSVDEVGRRALKAMRGVRPGLFDEEGRRNWCGVGLGRGFGGGGGAVAGAGAGAGGGGGGHSKGESERREEATLAEVRYVKSAVEIEGLRNGFSRGTRPNGFDELGDGWEGWEVDEEMLS